ncbi:MAG: hypothetical protein CM1200mP23_2820 [Nitrososphaerota archaeon]|nr:MAG: hypothetical protein CM1200mP23_2820 [Nitrososphaerota archaeon]
MLDRSGESRSIMVRLQESTNAYEAAKIKNQFLAAFPNDNLKAETLRNLRNQLFQDSDLELQ